MEREINVSVINTKDNKSNKIDNNNVNKFTYQDMDIAPFRVMIKMREDVNNTFNNDRKQIVINKIKVGSILKNLNIKGISDIKKLNKKCLIAYFDNKEDANKITTEVGLRLKGLEAFIPKFFISVTGIIRDIPIDLDEEIIRKEIYNDNKIEVLDIYRFKRKVTNLSNNNTELIKTGTIKITFRANKLRKEINLFYTKIQVKPFIQMVICCEKCLRYNHKTENCNSSKFRCGKCQENHETKTCDKTPKCINCGENHITNDKGKCMEYHRQKNIKTVMGNNNCTYIEAIENFPIFTSKNSFNILENIEENFPTLPRNSYAETTGYNFNYPRKIRNNNKYIREEIFRNNKQNQENIGKRDSKKEKKEDIEERGMGLNNTHKVTELEKEFEKLKNIFKRILTEKTNNSTKNYNYVDEDIEIINFLTKKNDADQVSTSKAEV